MGSDAGDCGAQGTWLWTQIWCEGQITHLPDGVCDFRECSTLVVMEV